MAGRSTVNPATEAKLYTIELGQTRCIAILRELMEKEGSKIRRDTVTGCVLYEGRRTKDGHWQIQRRPRYITRDSQRSEANKNQHKAYYVHRIAYVALYGQDIDMTGSHLCGNANCFNPYHILDESQHDNNNRQRCLGFIICPTHRLVLHKLCPHTPPCIKHPVHATQCCLAATSSLLESFDNKDTPPSVIGLPAIRNIEDFLDTQHNLPESQFTHTSEESAQDMMMSDADDEGSQNLPELEDFECDVGFSDAELPSSSQGPDYVEGN